MMLRSTGVIALSCYFLLSGCSVKNGGQETPVQAEIQSVYTDLGAASCKQEPDLSDPNETPYLRCPGVAGYSLIMRRVDSGRRSIDVVDAAQQAFPLDYQEFVTRHMFTLGDKAEWRVAVKDGSQVPVALIVRVRAQEDGDEPEKVTRSYFAVAKIEPGGACVTDRIPEDEQPEAEVRKTADSARERPCAPALPEWPPVAQ